MKTPFIANPITPENFTKSTFELLSLCSKLKTHNFLSFRLRSSRGMNLKKKFLRALFCKFGTQMPFRQMISLVNTNNIVFYFSFDVFSTFVNFPFPGDLALDLNRMPRGSKSVKTCNLDMAKKDGTVPHISLFKLKHMRGWWPFTVNTDLEEIELAVSFVKIQIQVISIFM